MKEGYVYYTKENIKDVSREIKELELIRNKLDHQIDKKYEWKRFLELNLK